MLNTGTTCLLRQYHDLKGDNTALSMGTQHVSHSLSHTEHDQIQKPNKSHLIWNEKRQHAI